MADIDVIDTDWAKNVWLPALESGGYRQVDGELYANPKSSGFPAMCCLGVACDLIDPEGWDFEVDYGVNFWDPSPEVSEHAPDIPLWDSALTGPYEPNTEMRNVINFCIDWNVEEMLRAASQFSDVPPDDSLPVDILITVNDESDDKNYRNVTRVIRAGLGMLEDEQ